MKDNETVIRRFIADWSSLDPDLLVAYFTEDGVYHKHADEAGGRARGAARLCRPLPARPAANRLGNRQPPVARRPGDGGTHPITQ